MEEADELCDRVAIIDHGKILVQDTPAALKGSVGRKDFTNSICTVRKFSAHATASATPGVTGAESTPNGVRIFAHGADGLLSDVVRGGILTACATYDH
jgi:ABC-2 type transport system ATP-binding protein